MGTESSGSGQDAKLAGLKDCPKCGRSNTADTRYCENCGANLTQVEAKQPAAEQDQKKKGLLGKLFR